MAPPDRPSDDPAGAPDPDASSGDADPSDDPPGPADPDVVDAVDAVTGDDAVDGDDASGEGDSDEDGDGDASGDREGDDDDEEEGRRKDRTRSAVEWVIVLAGAVIIAVVVRTFLFTTFWIPTGSMEPTLMGAPRNDRVVVNRLSYKLHDVNRGDIIVFDVPDGEPIVSVNGQNVEELIKRVIGLPGETVTLRDGEVYIDGDLLEEPYLQPGVETLPCGEESEFVVPEDSVFVMGDNRTMSRDARCWARHSVPIDDIVGRAFVRIWPLSEFGGL